jgi:hypothetical protein
MKEPAMTTDNHQIKLRRPRLLARAAHLGLPGYDRQKHLRRILGAAFLPSAHTAMQQLIEAEAIMEDQRKTGNATYRAARHVEVLIALLGEYRSVTNDGANPT